MTRPALIAADCLSALADTTRASDTDFEALALLPSDRAAAVDALRAMPEASTEHPHPRLIVGGPAEYLTGNLAARFIESGHGEPDRLEDYADALRQWDREEQEMGDGEKAGSE